MFSKIKQIVGSYWGLHSNKWFWIAHAFFFAGMLAVALFYQFGLGDEPCPLCVLIRSFVFGMMVVSLGMAIKPNRGFLSLGLMALVFLGCYALTTSIESYQIELGQIMATCGVDAPFPSWLPLHKILPFMFDPTGMCGDSPIMPGGFTMNQLLVIVFSILEIHFLFSSLPYIMLMFVGKKKK